ncbi:MAG: type II toxin-antitoxin system HicA family toxin [Alphaproteobacteria bacterium]|nr:type II toxin-antitoxin system HicA family toxin [Alphaproteobacteria bacterium]
MEANPKADWVIQDLVSVAEKIGVLVRPPSKGSHYTFSGPKLEGHLTVPAKRPIKPPYIRNFVGLCRAHIESLKE